MSSIARTLIITTILAGVVLVGYWRLTFDQQQKAIEELSALNGRMQDQLAQREAMVQRLSRSRRIAHIDVLEQKTNEAGKIEETRLRFIELDNDGTELARQTFVLPGDVVFVDSWTVKFDPQRVAEGDPLYGKTLVLLNSMYTDRMEPRQGLKIDTPGAVPPGYAVGEIGHFERQLWKNFWEIATNAEVAREMGVRVAQGEAVYKPMRAGQTYELIVDAVGGMSLRPLDPQTDSEGTLTRAKD